jgi:hypothetical protein
MLNKFVAAALIATCMGVTTNAFAVDKAKLAKAILELNDVSDNADGSTTIKGKEGVLSYPVADQEYALYPTAQNAARLCTLLGKEILTWSYNTTWGKTYNGVVLNEEGLFESFGNSDYYTTSVSCQ